MKTTITELTPHNIQLEIETDWADVAPDYADATLHYRNAPLPGYRPGRAPLARIAQHHHRDICAAAARTAAARLTRDALRRETIRTTGPIAITDAQLTPGQPFRCAATFTRGPSLILPDYTHLSAAIPAAAPVYESSSALTTLPDEIADWLVAHTPFEIPRSLIDEQLDPSTPDPHEAEQRARLLLITREIADREGIEITARELDARIDELACDSQTASKTLRHQLETTGGIESLRSFLLAETVLNYLAQNLSQSQH